MMNRSTFLFGSPALLLAGCASGSLVPNASVGNGAFASEAIVGETKRIAGALPQGWMACDGRALSPNRYRDLFRVLGYSAGKRGNTFLLPRMTGYAIAVRGVFPSSPSVINAVASRRRG